MRTLYLDIDGVLNSYEDEHRYGEKGVDEFYNLFKYHRSKEKEFDIPSLTMQHLVNLHYERCLALLILCRSYGIDQIILCTSWRMCYSVEDMRIFFIAKGFPKIADLIQGECPFTNKTGKMTDRDNDILTHMNENAISDYYILDDEVFDLTLFEKKRLLYVAFQELYHNYVLPNLSSIELMAQSYTNRCTEENLERMILESTNYEKIMDKVKGGNICQQE